MNGFRSISMAFLMLLSTVLIAGVFAEEANEQRQEPNVYGHLLDDVTEEGVQGLIYVMGGPDKDIKAKIETDESGNFKILLPPGPYVYETQARGYQSTRGEFMVPREGAARVIIKISELDAEPEGTFIHGVVYEEGTDTPLHAMVTVHNENGFKEQLETDRSGMFKVQVRPGLHYWLAEARGYESQKGRLEVPEEGARFKIEMAPIAEEPEANLFGFMHMARSEKPVQGVVKIWNEYTEMMVKTDEEGKFQLLLRPGKYYWHAEARGFEPNRGEIEVSKDGSRLVIGMIPKETQMKYGIVYGKVMTPDGDPIEGAEIMFMGMRREAYTDADDPIRSERDGRPDRDPNMPPGEDPNMPPEDPGMPPKDDERPEIPPENDERRERHPEENMFHAMTNEEGMFKIRLPFGAYHAMVHHPEFQPWEKMFKLTESKIRTVIILEPMEMPPETGGMKITMNKVDKNSDGIFELIHFEADLNGDGIAEFMYHREDRNSDGDPESVEWVLDLPMDRMERIMGLLRMFMERRNNWDDMEFPPMPDEPCCSEEENDMDIWELVERWQDEEYLDDDGETDDQTDTPQTDLPLDGAEEETTPSDKTTKSTDDGQITALIAALAVLALISVALAGSLIYVRRKH